MDIEMTLQKQLDTVDQYCKYCVCSVRLEVGKSGGWAAKKLIMCGFSESRHAIECFENHPKNNQHVNSVFYLQKIAG